MTDFSLFHHDIPFVATNNKFLKLLWHERTVGIHVDKPDDFTRRKRVKIDKGNVQRGWLQEMQPVGLELDLCKRTVDGHRNSYCVAHGSARDREFHVERGDSPLLRGIRERSAQNSRAGWRYKSIDSYTAGRTQERFRESEQCAGYLLGFIGVYLLRNRLRVVIQRPGNITSPINECK